MATAGYVTDDHVSHFNREGYCILERVLSNAQLTGLRSECARFMKEADDRLDAQGVEADGITHKGKRYFISRIANQSRPISDYIFGDLMADVSQALLGQTAFFFWDQFVVKCSEVGMRFAWHQDSAYVGHEHTPYITCYTTLDDYTEENGTIYLLPRSRIATKGIIEHKREDGSNDLVGYFGEDPGVPAIVPAGSLVVFSSLTLHRSSANTTKGMRRGFLVAYSPDIVMNKEHTQPFGWDVPFVWNGQRIRRGAPEQLSYYK